MVDNPQSEEAQGQEAPQKKSKLPMLIIIVVGVLALAGGGFFAYTKFLAPPPVSPVEEIILDSKNVPEVIGEIVTLKPFTVNLADPRGKRYLKVKIEIELSDAKAAERTTKAAPKLSDTVIMMLTSLSFEEVMTPEGKIRIRDELMERFSKILKPDRVKNIYFTEFVVQ